ncbi:2-amino-4-hydroxy-6-hydroxymethyldihydropteridine diphosphokinase [Vaginisenegalia massiliensis]|uniref:2-amino-4-hydroxy-6- hydroxymethyldihydropteridine diphosphokinase n=1 Tax=Vaginisenegalia massiliensis TaxID=2058294 RepID=UPI000F53BE21|nr:2-amino-4-hydroxy-6-hydroxymethyldihydropteridine diphosphokinase [Vaginisenegalia massiliensis]
MDQLAIKKLKVYAYHGVFAAEKELGQHFILNVTLDYDMSKAAYQGNLRESIHYGVLCQQLTEWMLASKEDLIETVATKLVDQIFEHYSLVQAVTLEIEKPEAPVPLALDTCAVKISRQRKRAFVALGSNEGERLRNLEEAIHQMQVAGLKITQVSTVLETPAWGKTDQADFLNQVVEVDTWWTAPYLLSQLQSIEERMGRVRHEHWGPRNIDLDLLFYGQEVWATDDLILPHPYISERAFVLEPMVEIAPHWLHPVSGRSMRQLLNELK